MKKAKHNILLILSGIYIVITAVVNVFGYYHLPAEIATQFSITGGNVNRMATPIYLMSSFFIILVLSILLIRKEKEQQIKYFVINSLITVLNIVMIFMQIE